MGDLSQAVSWKAASPASVRGYGALPGNRSGNSHLPKLLFFPTDKADWYGFKRKPCCYCIFLSVEKGHLGDPEGCLPNILSFLLDENRVKCPFPACSHIPPGMWTVLPGAVPAMLSTVQEWPRDLTWLPRPVRSARALPCPIPRLLRQSSWPPLESDVSGRDA